MQCPKLMQWCVACLLLLLLAGIASVTFSSHRGYRNMLDARDVSRFEVVRFADSSFHLLKNGEPFVVKGVCYSPMEINSDINDAAVAPDSKSSKSHVVSAMFGDWFWDSPLKPGTMEQTLRGNWFGLWGSGSLTAKYRARGDLAKIAQTLHANALRVYFMQSRAYEDVSHKNPKRPQDCEKRTHTAFLDEAYGNGLYVLVGLPLPIQLFHADDYEKANDRLIEWWEFVLAETVAEVGNHPAILGFTIMNELDDEPNAFPGQGEKPKPDRRSDFFHNQAVKYASVVKSGAPDKLVGWALHDVPVWLGFAANATPSSTMEYLDTGSTYLDQISSVFDYYGVNTYQSKTLMSVLGPWGDHGEIGGGGKAYGAPSIAHRIKPVLVTEIGWPATGRANLSDPASTMVDNVTTEDAVAEVINNIFPQIYKKYKHISIGGFYFEYTDEWWKVPKPLAASKALAGAWHHDGGNNCQNFGFPNLCNDEESFGLYARARAGGRSVKSPNFDDNGIVLPVDDLIPRSPMVDALAAVFASNLTALSQVMPSAYDSAAAIPRTPRMKVSTWLWSCMWMLGIVGFFLASNLRRHCSSTVQLQDIGALKQPFLQAP